jgi:hypothetical protein
MSHQVICPSCKGAATRMPIMSDVSHTSDYFHCSDCKQVSSTPKNGSGPAEPLKLSPAQNAGPDLDGAGF